MSAMPAYADALTLPPGSHVVADGIDVPRDFMTWHTWILKPRPETFFDKHVAAVGGQTRRGGRYPFQKTRSPAFRAAVRTCNI